MDTAVNARPWLDHHDLLDPAPMHLETGIQRREDGTLLWSVKCCNSGGNDFAQAPDGSLWTTFAEGKIFRIPPER